MANTINYVWTINSLYTVQAPQPDYVVNCIWTLTGTDSSTPPNVASIGGNTVFNVKESDPNFVPYAQLTEATVIGWVQASLGADGIANYEANINGQIESIINPPVSPANTPLPWNAAPTAPAAPAATPTSSAPKA